MAQAVVKVFTRLADRLRRDRETELAVEMGHGIIGTQAADRAIEELSPPQIAALNRYVSSPDFESLALRIAAAVPGLHDDAEDFTAAVREELREGLRLACSLPPEHLLTIADTMLSALKVATAEMTLSGDGFVAVWGVAGAGHVTAAAARNGRLLARLPELAAIHEQAGLLRRQVAKHYETLRLPHTGTSRLVAWDRLYVTPHLLPISGALSTMTGLGGLRRPGRFTVVLGDPGAGKSTLAAKVAHECATDPDSLEVPFLVVLRDYAEALSAGDRTLAEHLGSVAKAPHNIAMSMDAIEYLLLNGRAVVILDGLDELTDVSLRRRVTELVRSFVSLYSTTPVLVTSRRVGYSDAPLDPGTFDALAIAPFDDERVAEYATNWFDLNEALPAADRPRLRQAFLRESEPIRDLRSNPLLLSLLCSMYATEQYIPRNRAQVYERCAIMVFDRWDAMRKITVPIEFEGKVRGAIQELAWHLFTQGGQAELPRHRVQRIIVDYLCAKRFDEDDARAMAQRFLDFCAGRAWVLAEVGATDTEPIYGFAHRTFLEYFAAERLVRHNPTPEAVWRILEPHIGDGAWEVVGQLALQLLERNVDDGAETLLRFVLDSDQSRAALAFAARAAGQVGLSPHLLDRITRDAVDNVLRIPLDQRTHFWIDSATFEAIAAEDRPLHSLMFQSLRGNVEYIRRALHARLSERAAGADDMALYLISQLGRRFDAEDADVAWESLQAELTESFRDELTAWDLRHPWRLLTRCTSDDPAAVHEVVDRFGVSAFYLTDTLLGATTYPRASSLLFVPGTEPGQLALPAAARALRDRLLIAPRPWIDGDRWRQELRRLETHWAWQVNQINKAAWASSGEDLATVSLLALPYLEGAALRGLTTWADGARRLTVARHGDFADQRAWIREAYEPELADLLLCWALWEFSAVGPPSLTEK